MSTYRAIASITEYLRAQLIEAVKVEGGDSTTITVGPPDKARGVRTDGQLNLFLYQILPDGAWRNRDTPGKVKAGERAAPLLALRLGYLLTAFGAQASPDEPDDPTGHALLGTAMRKLHDQPQLDLEEEPVFELPRATLQPLSLDEMSKVWSGLQSPYRVTVAYEVGPVLIESSKSMKSAPPVLSRGESSHPDGNTEVDDPGFPAAPGSPPAEITRLKFPTGQAGVRLQDELIVEGQGLDRVNVLDLKHATLSTTHSIALGNGLIFDRSTKQLRWRVPDDPIDPNHPSDPPQWPAGLWTLSAGRRPAGNDAERREFSTAPVPFALLPEIVLDEVNNTIEHPTLDVDFAPNGKASEVGLTLRLQPRLFTSDSGALAQSASVFVSDSELAMTAELVWLSQLDVRVEFSQKDPDIADRLYQKLKDMPPARRYVRVKIAGADSSLLCLPFDPKTSPRQYDDNLTLVVP